MRQLLPSVFALLLAATAVATAQSSAPRRPDDDPPPQVEVLHGDSAVSAHISRHSGGLASCAMAGSSINARIRISWNARGRARSILVSGGPAGFRRCAKRALAGVLPIARRRAGAGSVAVIIQGSGRTASTPVDLRSCTVDSDCTLHFRTDACVHGDPIGVNRLDPVAVRQSYPVNQIACAMGGPQYEELRMSVEGRWSVSCKASRCEVEDHGPQKTRGF